jgi:4-hydroxybenzoate polyprenyltransferase
MQWKEQDGYQQQHDGQKNSTLFHVQLALLFVVPSLLPILLHVFLPPLLPLLLIFCILWMIQEQKLNMATSSGALAKTRNHAIQERNVLQK